MKKLINIICCVTIVMVSFSLKDQKVPVAQDFKIAAHQYSKITNEFKDPNKFPLSSDKDGALKTTNAAYWTSGFWAGDLWYLYEYTHDAQWKDAALKWTNALEKNQFNTSTHDLGFMMYCSYGNAYRITGDKSYKDILIQSANSLMTRFNPQVGCIKSWDQRLSWDGKTMWHYPVIIDNMMNLELLFFASKQTGNPVYRNVAIKHAETTLKNHIRPDFSSYHVINYDEQTGKVLNRETCQGYADNSTWARGQAWGIYGFTMVYRETKDPKFLNAARKMADFYMTNPNLPKDKIPYWDFNANQDGYIPLWKHDRQAYAYIPRDASAAAIVSSALLELCAYLGADGDKYKSFAIETLKSLSSAAYVASPDGKDNFVLEHSVGSFPHNDTIDAQLVYADYYFLEALSRYQKLTK